MCTHAGIVGRMFRSFEHEHEHASRDGSGEGEAWVAYRLVGQKEGTRHGYHWTLTIDGPRKPFRSVSGFSVPSLRPTNTGSGGVL